jgi:UDP-glucose 4-epimerase
MRIAQALGRPARLLTLPVSLLVLAGQLTGKQATIARLTGSLQIDDSDFRRDLGWSPPYTIEEGLKQTAVWLQNE